MGYGLLGIFFANAILNHYYNWINNSKSFEIDFLGTIVLLPRAKFCGKVVLCQFFRYYKAGKASCDPLTWC
jgi:hypothetical protein